MNLKQLMQNFKFYDEKVKKLTPKKPDSVYEYEMLCNVTLLKWDLYTYLRFTMFINVLYHPFSSLNTKHKTAHLGCYKTCEMTFNVPITKHLHHFLYNFYVKFKFLIYYTNHH